MNELRALASNRSRRYLLASWRSRGGGFYGFVALLTFLYIEGLDLAGDVAGLAGVQLNLGFIISWLVGNLVDAALNGIRAAIWPLEWISRFGISLRSAVLLAASYGAYRLIRPTVVRLLTPTDEPLPALEQTRG